MPNSNYRKGADKERRIVNRARAKGNLALRSAGSHSPIDVVIVDYVNKVIKLVQSKPDSMSELAKKRILAQIRKYNGIYVVETFVE